MTLHLFMVPEPVVALGVCAKVTLVLAAACGTAACLRRSAATVRHLVWALAMGLALGLVLSTPLVSRIPLLIPITLGTERGLTSHGLALGLGVLSTLWLPGAIALGAWFAAGHVALARLAFRARRSPLHPSPGDGLARELRAHGARVLWSDDVDVPLTWGIFRPVVLVPMRARAWPADRLRVALRHELAHVARRDLLAQALAAAVCTLFWCNPLAWYGLRRLRAESELACDDLVLLSGTEPAEYASTLLAVARPVRRSRAFGTAAEMASGPHLESRVRSILDGERVRTAGRRTSTVLVLAAVLILLPLASLRTELDARFAPAPPGISSLR